MSHSPSLIPPPRLDMETLFAALPNDEPVRSTRLAELLDLWVTQDRRDDAWVRGLYDDLLEHYAVDGDHRGFLRTLALRAVWLPIVQRRDRTKAWLFRWRVARNAVGQRRALQLMLVPDFYGPASHE